MADEHLRRRDAHARRFDLRLRALVAVAADVPLDLVGREQIDERARNVSPCARYFAW
jgi:hypothetical protein